MRKISKYSILGLFLVLLGFASCDMLRTAEQDAMPIVEPNDTYPVIASFTIIQGQLPKEIQLFIHLR